MTSDRDRLIELLKETETNPEKTCPHYLEADCFKCPYDKGEDCDHEARKADYLLANGVFLLPEDLRGTEDFSISAFIEAMQMYKQKDRYIKTPCKVGDKVCSLIFQKGNIFSHFLEETYVGIHLSNAPDLRGHRRKNYIIVWNENTNSIRHININKIGKTVFLTKEEAEKKLKELKENA